MSSTKQPLIYLIAHNIRSTHNVGSLLRTADGLDVATVYLTGYSPYPEQKNDSRLPHEVQKTTKAIHKTALGAQHTVNWQHDDDIKNVLRTLKKQSCHLIALEQHKLSRPLHDYKNIPDKLALLVGNEVDGIDEALLQMCDDIVEIPMLGEKESFNVSVAAAITLYRFRFSR